MSWRRCRNRRWDKWAAKGEKTNAFDPEPIRRMTSSSVTTPSATSPSTPRAIFMCRLLDQRAQFKFRAASAIRRSPGAYVDRDGGRRGRDRQWRRHDALPAHLPRRRTDAQRNGAAGPTHVKRIEDAGYNVGGGDAVIRTRDGLARSSLEKTWRLFGADRGGERSKRRCLESDPSRPHLAPLRTRSAFIHPQNILEARHGDLLGRGDPGALPISGLTRG